MPRSITRKTLIPFGNTGPLASFAQFGSQAASAPTKSKDPAVIQSLAAWLAGWQNALAAGGAPYLEDMNAVHYLMSYMQAYILQEGVAEWDAGTTYFIGSIVKAPGTADLYSSLTDANLANALPSRINSTNWRYLLGPKNVVAYAANGSPSVVTPDASASSTFAITLGNTVTVNGPINGVDGQKVVFRMIQDAGGSHAGIWNTGAGNFAFSPDVPSITLSAGSNAVDYVGAIYSADRNVWHVVALTRGY